MHAPTNSGPAKNRPSGISRLKPRLRGGAAWMILPAIAMVVPLGVALSPAQAAGTFTFNADKQDVVLSAGTYAGANEFTLNANTLSGVTRMAVYGDASQTWTFHNNNRIVGGNYDGLTMRGEATILNAGSISGYTSAVYLGAGGAVINGSSVNNTATISGTGFSGVAGIGITARNIAATVTNYGIITGTNNGIYLAAGGEVTNSGSISGIHGIAASGPIIVNNDGTISGTTYGVLGGFGTVYNSGSIGGSTYTGVSLFGGSVQNSGTITGAGKYGVWMGGGGGTVVNTNTIQSGGYGVLLTGGGTISNTGSITGAYSGIKLTGGSGATIANGDASHTAALISGVRNGILSDSAGLVTVTNYGTIMNSGSGVNAIVLNAGGVVDNRTGGVINGDTVTNRGGGVRISGGTGTVTNAGIIASPTMFGVYLDGGGTIINGSSSNDSAYINGVRIDGAGRLVNYGHIGPFGAYLNGPATVINAGTITGSDTGLASLETINLTNSGTIAGGTYGLTSLETATVANSGTITGGGYGLYLKNGGLVTNTGSITANGVGINLLGDATIINGDANHTTALISGGAFSGSYGIESCSCTTVTLTNDGIIQGDTGVSLEGGGTIINSGLIYGYGGKGIYLYSGGVTNTGTITGGGGTGVYIYNPNGVVTNTGAITGGGGHYGIFLQGGGTITNGNSGNHGALISGDKGGIDSLYSATVNNFGIISGTGAPSGGVLLERDGVVNNYAGATILGYYLGVGIGQISGAGTVNNSGIIATTALSNGVSPQVYGVQLLSGGQVTNNAGGSITGDDTGVRIRGGVGIVTNAGTIQGAHYYGVQLRRGTVTNSSTALISGYAIGVYVSNGAGTVDNAGTIIGAQYAGVLLSEGGIITNGSSSNHAALISGDTFGVYAGSAGIQINNFGIISGTGKPSGGVILNRGGLVNNYAGATISGYYSGVAMGDTGTLNNSGIITNTTTAAGGFLSFAAVQMYGGGLVNNQGLIQGSTGVVLSGFFGPSSDSTIINGSASNHSAAIIGTATVSGYGISAGVLGIQGALVNYGTVTGGTAGAVFLYGGGVTNQAGGTISGGGLGVLLGSGTVTNNGVITATGTGSGLLPFPSAGVAVLGLPGDTVTVTNNEGASIAGDTGVYAPVGTLTLTNFGTITGTGGTAVYGPLSGSRLILGQGYKFNGAVTMGGTLEWAKGTGTLSNLAALNSNFTDLEIDQGAIITNAGSGAAVINVTNKGTIAPTAPVNLTGNFVQTSSGTLQTVLGPDGGATTLNITGAASLDGNVVVVPNGVSPSTYTILTATGGVSGSFASVSGGTLLLKPSLSYDAKDAFVTLNQQPVTSVAATPNQLALAGALDKGLAANPAFFAPLMTVINQFTDPAKLTGVLESLTGEGHASLSTLGLVTGFNMIGAFQQHSQGTIGPNEAPDDPWITGFAQSGHFSPIGSQAVHENVMGATAGADHVFFPGFRGGVMAGMGVLHANVGPNAQASINYQQVALTADYVNGAWFADGLIGFSHSRGNTVRTIPALGLAATGHPVTNQVIAGAEGGYAVTLDEQFSLVPFAGLDVASANSSAFTETGAGALNLAVAAQATTSTRSILGARFKGVNVDVAGLAMTTELKMGWAHQFTGLAPITRASFAGVAGTDFTVTGAPLPGDAGVVGLGAAVAVADNASMQLRYDGQYSGNAASHTISFGLAVDW